MRLGLTPDRKVSELISRVNFGFVLGLLWVCLALLTLKIGPKLALIGFVLALYWVCLGLFLTFVRQVEIA